MPNNTLFNGTLMTLGGTFISGKTKKDKNIHIYETNPAHVY